MHELLILVEQTLFLFQVYIAKHMQIGFIRKVKTDLDIFHLELTICPQVHFIIIMLKLTILSFITKN